MSDCIKIVGNNVFVSDGERFTRGSDPRPLREQIADLVASYNCEWDVPAEVAERIIALVQKAQPRSASLTAIHPSREQ